MAQAWNLDAAIVSLGREFKRRGMTGHLADLRRLWSKRQTDRLAGVPRQFDEGLAIEWLCLLRIPPFDGVYPVLSRDAPCPSCGSLPERGAPSTFILVSFAGGWLERCRACKTCWLHEDGDRSGISQ